MKRSALLKLMLMLRTKHAVETAAGLEGPQGAVVGIVISEAFEHMGQRSSLVSVKTWPSACPTGSPTAVV